MGVEDNNLYGKAYGLKERGRHKTMSSAFDAAFKDLTTEKNPFFDSLVDNWKTLFPTVPAKPGRYEDGKIFIYVKEFSGDRPRRMPVNAGFDAVGVLAAGVSRRGWGGGYFRP